MTPLFSSFLKSFRIQTALYFQHNTFNQYYYMHCEENPIYVLPEKKLRGLSPSFHIHVSVSDLHILTNGPHIFLQQNRQTYEYINCSQKLGYKSWD
jgi:hypothetical protein